VKVDDRKLHVSVHLSDMKDVNRMKIFLRSAHLMGGLTDDEANEISEEYCLGLRWHNGELIK
jgi:hypothetical protein